MSYFFIDKNNIYQIVLSRQQRKSLFNQAQQLSFNGFFLIFLLSKENVQINLLDMIVPSLYNSILHFRMAFQVRIICGRWGLGVYNCQNLKVIYELGYNCVIRLKIMFVFTLLQFRTLEPLALN